MKNDNIIRDIFLYLGLNFLKEKYDIFKIIFINKNIINNNASETANWFLIDNISGSISIYKRNKIEEIK